MGRKRALIAGKHLIYCFGLIFCYVLQTTPGFLQIFGVKPFLVIPAVIAIAMQEGEFTGALYGALGGICLLYTSSASPTAGRRPFPCCGACPAGSTGSRCV